MLVIRKNAVYGIADFDTLLIAKTSNGTVVEAVEAGKSILKCFADSEFVKAIPIRKKLKEGEHHTPPKGYPESKREYAVPEYYMFPIDDEEHVRAALSYFSKHPWKPSEHKKEAAKRILSAAKKHGIHVSKDSDVYRAAHT